MIGSATSRVKVVLNDGAKWIWNVALELFPGAVENSRPVARATACMGAGLPVGSGVAESTGDTVAGHFKRGEMRWVVERGANSVLTLRCWWLDGRHDGFFTVRARSPPMALAA